MEIIINKNIISAIKSLQNSDLMIKLLKKYYGTRKTNK